MRFFIIIFSLCASITASAQNKKLSSDDWVGIAAKSLTDRDFSAAEFAYKMAVEMDSTNANAYQAWGDYSFIRMSIEKDTSYYRDCVEKFQRALELDTLASRKDMIYNNWGTALLRKSKILGDFNTNKDEIIDLFMKGGGDKKMSTAYNMACFYSLSGEKKKALEWLEKCLKIDDKIKTAKGFRQSIESDPDFDNIRSDSKFTNLFDKYLPKKTK